MAFKAVTQCVKRSKKVKVYREVFQVIRHSTEKSLVYFVAVILKVLLVNLLATVNFANVILNRKRFGK